MKQGVEIGEAGTLRGQGLQARIVDGSLVVDILEDDDQDAIEVVILGACRRTGCFFALSLFGLRDLRLSGLILRCRSNALRDSSVFAADRD